jgi:hypothetical protein
MGGFQAHRQQSCAHQHPAAGMADLEKALGLYQMFAEKAVAFGGSVSPSTASAS